MQKKTHTDNHSKRMERYELSSKWKSWIPSWWKEFCAAAATSLQSKIHMSACEEKR